MSMVSFPSVVSSNVTQVPNVLNMGRTQHVEDMSIEGRITRIRDALRGTLYVDTPEQIRPLYNKVIAWVNEKGGIYDTKNYFAEPKPSGYVGIHIIIGVPLRGSECVCMELQIHLRDIMDGTENCPKEKTHPLYKHYDNADERTKKDINSSSQYIYFIALQKLLNFNIEHFDTEWNEQLKVMVPKDRDGIDRAFKRAVEEINTRINLPVKKKDEVTNTATRVSELFVGVIEMAPAFEVMCRQAVDSQSGCSVSFGPKDAHMLKEVPSLREKIKKDLIEVNPAIKMLVVPPPFLTIHPLDALTKDWLFFCAYFNAREIPACYLNTLPPLGKAQIKSLLENYALMRFDRTGAGFMHPDLASMLRSVAPRDMGAKTIQFFIITTKWGDLHRAEYRDQVYVQMLQIRQAVIEQEPLNTRKRWLNSDRNDMSAMEQALTETDSDLHECFQTIAKRHQTQGNYEKAFEMYFRAMSIKPNEYIGKNDIKAGASFYHSFCQQRLELEILDQQKDALCNKLQEALQNNLLAMSKQNEMIRERLNEIELSTQRVVREAKNMFERGQELENKGIDSRARRREIVDNTHLERAPKNKCTCIVS